MGHFHNPGTKYRVSSGKHYTPCIEWRDAESFYIIYVFALPVLLGILFRLAVSYDFIMKQTSCRMYSTCCKITGNGGICYTGGKGGHISATVLQMQQVYPGLTSLEYDTVAIMIYSKLLLSYQQP